MYIAIDDTYGPSTNTYSGYVTGERRTHVGVVFPDEHVDMVRSEIRRCIQHINETYSMSVAEMHFVDLFNRRKPWDILEGQINLAIFKAFTEIYKNYKWPVIISTLDKRTLADYGIDKIDGKIDDLDLSKVEDISVFILCCKIKKQYNSIERPLTIYIDEGRKAPGHVFGTKIFHNWRGDYKGFYQSSCEEPLLQMADLLAFCINRSTHLAMKERRSEVDNWFLEMVGGMSINCDDLKVVSAPANFDVNFFDGIHHEDRVEKGLEGK